MKAIVRKCFLCKKFEGLSYPSPVSSYLPHYRVEGGQAFKTTGVDFCGPLYIKEVTNNMSKWYVALFTCATSMMIHLELTPDISTPTYVRCQRRFIARRGTPSLMISDNGKVFKGRALKNYNSQNGITWRFNLPRTAWWGGIF